MVGVVRAGPGAGGSVSVAEWPPKTIPPPREVTSSVQLWLANIVASVVIGVVSLLLVPAAAVLMWRPAAKSYFADNWPECRRHRWNCPLVEP